jgi:5-(carboxyamino)imidazole ribonucleotide synthase
MWCIYDSGVNERFPTVGIIGAGELARMTFAPAAALGINLLLFAQSSDESAAQIAPHTVGDYRDLSALREFATKCDVITIEDERVPLSVVKSLEISGVKVSPGSHSLQYSQDKAAMLQKLAQTNPQISVEELIDFECEIAVTVARSAHGQATTWAPTQTVKSAGICIMSIAPAPCISQDMAEKAQQLALSTANEISLIGVMAVEFFVKGDALFINTLTMRTHNSGHWTIDGSRTSQFEQHLRAILDLPLGDPAMTSRFAVMANIVAGEKSDMYRPYLHLMARNPQLKFHQYKKEVRKGQIIGHVTAVGENLPELIEIAEHASGYMSGEIDE